MFGSLWRKKVRPRFRHVPVGYLSKLHRARRAVFPSRYTDADPFKLLCVSPSEVSRECLRPRHRLHSWGLVEGGSWDTRADPFDERPVPRALRRRYVEGADWDDTGLRQVFEQQRRSGLIPTAWGHGSFEARCEEIDRLHDSMNSDGYLTQEELVGTDGSNPLPVFDEINVDIGRDGRFVWCGFGQHRLALARILGLDEVVVVVQRRHAGWQEKRDGIRQGGTVDADHPDLRDLRDSDSQT